MTGAAAPGESLRNLAGACLLRAALAAYAGKSKRDLIESLAGFLEREVRRLDSIRFEQAIAHHREDVADQAREYHRHARRRRAP